MPPALGLGGCRSLCRSRSLYGHATLTHGLHTSRPSAGRSNGQIASSRFRSGPAGCV